MPSGKILARKQEEVRKIIDKYSEAKIIVFLDYLGLTVAQDTELRAGLREKDLDYKVVKNRLLLKAFKEMDVEGIEEILQGPTAVAMSVEDYVPSAKACTDAEKKYKALEIKGGMMDGKVISVEEVKAIANLPTREELVAKVLCGMNAPISGFVNVLAANLSGLARVVKAIAESRSQE
jgi:large subunit ribosomal protein L10